jgi:AraC-like DNA-binding protein
LPWPHCKLASRRRSLRSVRKTLPTVRADTAPADTTPPLDALSEVLRTVTLTGATFFSAEFQAPWGFTSPPSRSLATPLDADAHLVLFHLVLEGQALARLEGSGDVSVKAGDIITFPQGHAHRMWQGQPPRWYDTEPLVRRALAGSFEVERTAGPGDRTRFVCGYFRCDSFVGDVILAGLPPLLTISVRDDERRSWLEEAILFLAAEATSDHAGRSALLTKLSEALFVETLRRWMARLPPDQIGWLAGARDAVVGLALARLHREPARKWSVETLAHEVGASRSTLMDRFARYLGEPPMAYLARWRLRLGARLLKTSRHSVLEIATRVGYESEAAFNRAFRRQYGAPPGRYRRTIGAATTPRRSKSARA